MKWTGLGIKAAATLDIQATAAPNMSPGVGQPRGGGGGCDGIVFEFGVRGTKKTRSRFLNLDFLVGQHFLDLLNNQDPGEISVRNLDLKKIRILQKLALRSESTGDYRKGQQC